MLVATAGEVGLKETLKALSNTLGGIDLVAKLAVKTSPLKYRPKYEESIANDVEKASKKFYKALKSDKPLPAFKIQSEKVKQYFPADYDFYKDKENFFYETKVNPLKTFAAKLLMRLVLRSFEKKYELK